MKFETTRFGQVEVKSEDIVIFPDGLLGFPDCTRYTLIDEDRAAPFRMLQSLENPALAFVVIDPLVVRQDYHFNVTKEDLEQIKTDTTENLQVLSIVTMSRDIRDVTVNLQGPLVVNPESKLGHQFVLIETDYTTKELLIQNKDEAVQPQAQGKSVKEEEKILQKKAV